MKLIHICEVYGRKEVLTPDEAYEMGWDYPPRMGVFGLLSPRTCPNCRMADTVWAQVALYKKSVEDLTDTQKETLYRILDEPESITPA